MEQDPGTEQEEQKQPYILLCATDAAGLSRQVNEKLAEGYTLRGDTFCAVVPSSNVQLFTRTMLYQAVYLVRPNMTRHE